jgi:hypothetical protein
MSEIRDAATGQLDPEQAIELSILVNTEACWENLRKPGPEPTDAGMTLRELSAKQSAYNAFHARLVAYNKAYMPAHVPELLLNTPSRLGKWCHTMRNLFLQVEHDPRCGSPGHVLEKAHRWADRIGIRLNRELVGRRQPPNTVRDVIRGLETVEQWCATTVATPA